MLFKPQEFENAGFSLSCGTENILKTEHSENGVTIIGVSSTEFTSDTNPKRPVIVAFLNSSGVVWTESI